jgi:hypothetical protein
MKHPASDSGVFFLLSYFYYITLVYHAIHKSPLFTLNG